MKILKTFTTLLHSTICIRLLKYNFNAHHALLLEVELDELREEFARRLGGHDRTIADLKVIRYMCPAAAKFVEEALINGSFYVFRTIVKH